MERQTNAGVICQGHDRSGWGENMAVVAEWGPRGTYEALICSAQGQALRTNYIKFYIDKTSESPMSRMCGDKGESVSHLTSAAS